MTDVGRRRPGGGFLRRVLFTVFRVFVLPAFVLSIGHELKVACCMNNK